MRRVRQAARRQTVTLPVTGHDVRRLPKPRAATVDPGAWRDRRVSESADGQCDGHIRPGRFHAGMRWCRSCSIPDMVPNCRSEHEDVIEQLAARDATTAQEYEALRLRAIVSGIAGAVAMVVSMPLMATNDHAGMGVVADPFMRWVMRALSPSLESALPWLYAIPAPVITWSLLAHDGRRDGVGRPAVLRQRVAGVRVIVRRT